MRWDDQRFDDEIAEEEGRVEGGDPEHVGKIRLDCELHIRRGRPFKMIGSSPVFVTHPFPQLDIPPT